LFGRGLFTCAVCDGPLYSGKRVSVVGGGDTGVGAALALSRYAAEVVLYERESSLTAQPALVDALARTTNISVRFHAEVTGAHGEEQLNAIQVVDRGVTAIEPSEGVMLAVGLRPRSRLVAGLVERDRNGAISVDRDFAASAPGVFAAGDVREAAAYRCAAAWKDGIAAAKGALAHLGAA
jgi:thioredoxin reductase (NADPH)